MADVQWPGKAIDPAGHDLAGPTADLLQKVNVLEDPLELTDAAGGLKWKTPPSVQVITAGATSLSKWVTMGIAALGGTTAIIAWIGGLWNTSNDSLKISYVALITIVMAALTISIAIIVKADVIARGGASAAEYAARATIAAAFLNAAPHVPETARYWVTRPASEEQLPVLRFEVVDGKLVVVTEHDRLNPDEIARLWSVTG